MRKVLAIIGCILIFVSVPIITTFLCNNADTGSQISAVWGVICGFNFDKVYKILRG